MAANTIPPNSLNFAFHDLHDHFQRCRALALLPAAAATANTAAAPSLLAGHLLQDDPTGTLEVRIDAGRLGTPSLQVSVRVPATASQQADSVVLAFEPGVAEGASNNPCWQLQEMRCEFLGRPGGAGHMYDHDPHVIRNLSVPDKKRTLRIIFKAHAGCTIYPNGGALTNVMQRLGPNHPLGAILVRLTSAPVVDGRLYCLIPAGQQDLIMNAVIAPFEVAKGMRLPPFHQYTPHAAVLTFSMPAHAVFRNSMYCSRRPDGTFSGFELRLPPTQGRRQPRPVSVVQSVGVIRETQAYERMCHRIGQIRTWLAVGRSWQTNLADHTRLSMQWLPGLPVPNEQQTFLAYVPSPLDTLLPGTVCRILWLDGSNHSAFGKVLSLPPSPALTPTGFMLALCLDPTAPAPHAFRQRAAVSVMQAALTAVTLTVVQNRTSAQSQLDTMRIWGDNTQQERIIQLQQRTCLYPTTIAARLANRRDVRHNAATWHHALLDIQASHIVQGQFSAAERFLLSTLPAQVDGPFQLIRTTPAHQAFKSIDLLSLLFMAVDRRVLLVCDSAPDRAKIAGDVHGMLSAAILAPHTGFVFRRKTVLGYTTMDMQVPANTNPGTMSLLQHIDLSFKLLVDDFSDHHAAPGQLGSTGVFSLGDAIQQYLHASPDRVREREYFINRAAHLNSPVAAETSGRLQHHQDVVAATLRGVDLLITDYTTATSPLVRAAFPAPVLILLGAHTVLFPTLMGPMVRYPDAPAVFVCGDPGPAGSAGGRFYSAGRSEAEWSFCRAGWEGMVVGGVGFFDLV